MHHPLINIFYGYTFNGIDFIKSSIKGELLNLYSLNKLLDIDLVFDRDISTNEELNNLLSFLISLDGIDKFINEDGSYRIKLHLFKKNIYGKNNFIEVPNPIIPISIEEINLPKWGEKLCRLYECYLDDLPFLTQLNINNPYIYTNKEYPCTISILDDILLKLKPNLSLSRYIEIKKEIKNDSCEYLDIRKVLDLNL